MADEAASSEVTAIPPTKDDFDVLPESVITSKVFTITPSPERPGAWVKLRRLPQTRHDALNEGVNMFKGELKSSRLTKKTQREMIESILDFGGFNDKTAPKGPDGKYPPLEVNNPNKLTVATTQFFLDGDITSVWLECQRQITKQLVDDEGNS